MMSVQFLFTVFTLSIGRFHDQSVQIKSKNTITDSFGLICYGLNSLVLNLFRFNVFLYHYLTVGIPTSTDV